MVPKHWYAYPVVTVVIVRIDPNANAAIKKTANILQVVLELLCSSDFLFMSHIMYRKYLDFAN